MKLYKNNFKPIIYFKENPEHVQATDKCTEELPTFDRRKTNKIRVTLFCQNPLIEVISFVKFSKS